MITPKDIAAHEVDTNFENWKDLATKSLKGKPLAKYMDFSSLEGIKKSVFYPTCDQLGELKTYPHTQEKTQFYDLKKYSPKHYAIDQELGVENFIFQVQKEKIDIRYLPKDKTQFHIQIASDEMLEHFKDYKILVDVNNLLFKDFSNEIKRVQSANSEAGFLIDLSHIHNAGGSVVQEMTYALSLYSALLEHEMTSSKIQLRVSCHSELFLNIAKLKALRLMLEKLCQKASVPLDIIIHGTNSLREQTLYDPWNNILRNSTSSMAQIMGGANCISTRSFDYLFSKLTIEKPSELAHRYANQSLNILFEESYIQKVMDPSKGSFYIESIAQSLIKTSWESYLNWRQRDFLQSAKDFSVEVEAIAKMRRSEVRKRKKVITGVNDFAEPTQTIESLYKKQWKPVELHFGFFPLRRLAYEFEALRINNELNPNKSKVCIITHGLLATINARLNFIQNIFDTVVIPYDVKEFSENMESKELADYAAIIFCAKDEAYGDIFEKVEHKRKVIAGIPHQEGIETIGMGMDVYGFVSTFIQGGEA